LLLPRVHVGVSVPTIGAFCGRTTRPPTNQSRATSSSSHRRLFTPLHPHSVACRKAISVTIRVPDGRSFVDSTITVVVLAVAQLAGTREHFRILVVTIRTALSKCT